MKYLFITLILMSSLQCLSQNLTPVAVPGLTVTENKGIEYSTNYDSLSMKYRMSALEFINTNDSIIQYKIDSIGSKMNELQNVSDSKKLLASMDEIEELLKMKTEHYGEYRKLKVLADAMEFYNNEAEVDKILLFKMNARLFKVKNATHAQMYFEGNADEGASKFLKNSLFSFNSEGERVSLFNELYSDYLGPFRLHFGALISADLDSLRMPPEEEKMNDAVQRLIGGGGNVVLGISYPVLHLSTLHNTFSSKIHFSPKLGFDVPELGQSVETSTTNLDLAFEGSFFLKGLNDIISIYGGFRYGYIIGSNEFDKNLNIDQNFWLGQYTIGLALNSAFRISYTRNVSSFKQAPFDLVNTISFSIVPN